MAFLDGEKGRSVRRKLGICAYVGANGSGKSLAAVFDSVPSLLAGRPVLSTVRLLDFENPRSCDDPNCEFPSHPDHLAAHPLWIPFTSWNDLLQAEHCDVIMDEVTGVASSREASALPAPVANFLVQLRRRDICLRWTSPAWARADRIIRECTQGVALCYGYFGKRDKDTLWTRKSLFKIRLLDARDLDELTESKKDRVRPIDVSFMSLKACGAGNVYDTLDEVLSIPLIEGGRCLVCGGRKKIPYCSCCD